MSVLQWIRRHMALCLVGLLVIVIGAVALVRHFSASGVGTDNGTAVGVPHVTSTDPGATFDVTPGDGPAPTLAALRPLGKAVQIEPHGSASGAVVHFPLNRKALPANEPLCKQPTTNVNLVIAVFNEHIQAWMPLKTTCSGDDLSAAAPHFSWYQTYILDPGVHAVEAVWQGVKHTVQVTTTVAMSGLAFVADTAKQIVSTFFHNLTNTFDKSQHVCSPASKTWTVAVESTIPDRLAGCMVNDHGEQLHFKNGNALPVILTPHEGVKPYLQPVDDGGGLDMVQLLQSFDAQRRSGLFVPGLKEGKFGVTDDAPDDNLLSGTVDGTAMFIELSTALLSIIMPSMKTESVELKLIFQHTEKRLTVLVAREGYAVVTYEQIKTVMLEVIQKELPKFEAFGEDALSMMDDIRCLGLKKDTDGIADAVYSCLSLVLSSKGGEVKDTLLAMADASKTVPEYALFLKSRALQAVAGPTDIDAFSVSINRANTQSACLTKDQFIAYSKHYLALTFNNPIAGAHLRFLMKGEPVCAGEWSVAKLIAYSGNDPSLYNTDIVLLKANGNQWNVVSAQLSYDSSECVGKPAKIKSVLGCE